MPEPVSIDEVRARVDFAVITIRPDEFEAVLERFSPRQPVEGGKQLYEYCRLTTDESVECSVVVVRSLEQGANSAQSVARDVIEDLDPRWLILVGIAGGVPDSEFSLGDVLLASRLHDFSVSAAIEGSPPTFEQTGGPMHPEVERLLAALPAWRDRLGDWSSQTSIGRAKPTVCVPKAPNARSLYGSSDWKRKVRDSLAWHFPPASPARPPLFHIGPSAGANVLLKDTQLLSRWQESARHLTHVEMEAGGVYQAAHKANLPLLCVRGISDIVGFRRAPEWTAYACHAAAALVHALIRRGPLRTGGRPRGNEARPIAVSKLPHGAEVLVGRDEELRRLDDAWAHSGTHVVSIVAWGGVGKTALAVEWMTRFAKRNWEGVDAYFDWSFYSQGTREQGAASADQFIAAALGHFRDADPQAGSPYDRGERLARLVAQQRTLLILDGLEPLQHGPGPLEGQLKDPALGALLKGLAQRPFAGLCVLTSRERVADLGPFHGKTVDEWELEHLSNEAGAKLLHRAGAKRAGAASIGPGDHELREASREVQGHALTLQLLGRYLALAHGGDVRRRDRVRFEKADAETQGGHAFRVIAAYERWLREEGESGARGDAERQLAVLRLLGVFDRPADAGCLEALRKPPVIAGLTEPLVGVAEEDWNTALTQLAELGLISRPSASPVPPSTFSVDAHPLVREYFAQQVRTENAEAWRAAHRRLYEHLCQTTQHWPDTLDALQPLYQAVAHGCQAGLQQKACHDVYNDRILRGAGSGGNYSTFKLGAIGADLGAVGCFFQQPWSRPSRNLLPADQAWLLNEAAFRLRALGRLTEAVEPMRAGLEMRIEQKNWKQAAISASNLSELELTLGRVSEAVGDGEQAVTFAERSEDAFQRMGKRTTHADALHQAGRCDQSLRLFREAEAVQAERQPHYPRLYSLPGFRYCDLLLADAERAAWCVCRVLARKHVSGADDTKEPTEPTSTGASKTGEPSGPTAGCKQSPYDLEACAAACDEVAERGRQWFQWRGPTDPLLDIALDHLTLGRAALYRAILSQSRLPNHHSSFILQHSTTDDLNAAVDGLRQAGQMDELPRGLLTRAWLRFLQGDESGCRADLDEAWEIAERGPMPLHQADVHLARARLFRDRQALALARRLIEDHGYHRRDEELADAEEMVRG